VPGLLEEHAREEHPGRDAPRGTGSTAFYGSPPDTVVSAGLLSVERREEIPLPPGTLITLQGAIVDPGAPDPRKANPTNAVEVLFE